MNASARRAGALALVLLPALMLAGCDSGPQGPGPLPATVVSPTPLGAVVLEFTGEGVTGFEARGSTRVFAAATSSTPGKRRVVLVVPAAATEIPFSVVFADRAGPMPAVAAVSAASADNAQVSAAGLKVQIER